VEVDAISAERLCHIHRTIVSTDRLIALRAAALPRWLLEVKDGHMSEAGTGTFAVRGEANRGPHSASPDLHDLGIIKMMPIIT
jgi:hypothetical protein